jgi:2-C-methyl-D-erythritol 4-phosphate cytidylyltransferase/2-C-methyl-D-erythritol 2,4-cyclodiphosphate synthase
VIIPAAGQARRFNAGFNKIWTELDGLSLLHRSVAAFNSHPDVSSIVIAASYSELDTVAEQMLPFEKVLQVVPGGNTRSESVRCGLDALPEDTEFVLVHDAARPLITHAVIDSVLQGVFASGAAVPGVAVADTVKRVDGNGTVVATIERTASFNGDTANSLTAVQTPQGARRTLLAEAYRRFPFNRMEPTDEASLLEAANIPVMVVKGDPFNLKITRQEDVALAESLLRANRPTQTIRTGFGYDVHAFAEANEGRALWLGGVQIEHDRGLAGHSDADVLLHAVCDALLGAASIGDIGMLFPNTDDAYKNISSLKLLAEVGRRLAEEKWTIANIDATVIAEAPRLLPHRTAIQEAIAGCLGIEPSQVSIKATTSEKLGFVGRREGIEASAVALISR